MARSPTPVPENEGSPRGSAGWLDGSRSRAADPIGALQDTISRAKGARKFALAFGAGAASVLAMPPFFLWPVLFLTLPVLVWLIDGAGGKTRARRALAGAGAGWWFGFGYLLAGLFWIGEAFFVEADKFAWLAPFAVVSLPAALAPYMAAAAGFAALLNAKGWSRLLILAVALSVAEWLRGHLFTGLPWNVLGSALTYPAPLMQGVSLFGVHGLTPWVVLIATAPLVLAGDAAPGRRLAGFARGAAVAAVPLCALWVYGLARLQQETKWNDAANLRIVQPSIPQREKWRPEKQREIFEAHIATSRRNASGEIDGLKGITHVIWPEAAMPFMPLSSPEALAAIGELLPGGTRLLSGALRLEVADGGERRAFNSLLALDSDGRLESLYDKVHLVPFGEYLPFQKTLEAMGLEQLSRMRGGFASGPHPRPIQRVEGLPPFVALICYEAIFPGEAVRGERPEFILNVTNDGWFGRTTGPHQHFHQTRLRAVEEGLPVLRVANNGISAVIDGRGRIYASLGTDEVGTIDTRLPVADGVSAYGTLGDWMFLATILAFCGFAALGAQMSKRFI